MSLKYKIIFFFISLTALTTIGLRPIQSLGGTVDGYNPGYVESNRDTLLPPSPRTPIFLDRPIFKKSYPVRVLSLRFLTDNDQNGQLDPETNAHYSVEEAKTFLDKVEKKIIYALEKGSIYQGYRYQLATPSLKYTIREVKNYYRSVPIQEGVGSEPANHQVIFKELGFDICDYVDRMGFKEIWIWMPHNNSVYPIESFQIGPLVEFHTSGLKAPRCQKSYTVYNYTLPAILDEPFIERYPLHNHFHHLEMLFEWIDKPLFVDNFMGVDYGCCPPGPAWIGKNRRCGNAHYPPNSADDYDYQNPAPVLSDCENWQPEGGEQKAINCQTWANYYHCSSCKNNFTDAACTEVAYYVWWMQNIPGRNNRVQYQGKKMINWWALVGDFDQTVTDLGPRVTATPTPLPTKIEGECVLKSISASDGQYKNQIVITTTFSDCPNGHQLHLSRDPAGWNFYLDTIPVLTIPHMVANSGLDCNQQFNYCAQAYNPQSALLYGPQLCDQGSTANCQ